MVKPGNPEWIAYLQKLKDKMAEKNPDDNRINSLGKAIKGLKANPVRLSRPEDALDIHGIGPKTVKMLEKAEAGDDSDDAPSKVKTKKNKAQRKADLTDDSDDGPPPASTSKAKKPTASKKREADSDSDDDQAQLSDTFDVLNPKATRKSIKGTKPPAKKVKKSVAANARTLASLDPADESDNAPASPKKKKRPSNASEKSSEKGKKPYAPKKNSCPYAILVAMYLHAGEDEEDWQAQGLNQEDLVQKAQPFTSTDMTVKVQPKGAKSGWGYSGVSCLPNLTTERGLIRKVGRAPIHYHLTEKGLRVARIAAEVEGQDLWPLPDGLAEDGEDDGLPPPKKKAKTSAASKGKGKARAVTEDEESEEEVAVTKKKKQPRVSMNARAMEEDDDEERPFAFFFIDDGGERTLNRSEAESTMSEINTSTLVKVEFRSAQSRHTLARYIEKKKRNTVSQTGPEGPTEFGFIPPSKVIAKAPGFPVKKAPRESASVKEKAVADLMGGQKPKKAADRGAMYKMPAQAKSSDAVGMDEDSQPGPSSTGFSYAANSDEEAEQLRKVMEASVAEAKKDSESEEEERPSNPAEERRKRAAAAIARAEADKKKLDASKTTTSARPKVVVEPPAASTSRTASAVKPVAHGSSSLNTVDRPMFQRNVSNIVRKFTPFDTSKAVIMRPGEFEVKLCIDSREKYYKKHFEDGVDAHFKVLELGDVVWIAERIRPSSVPENDIIVLDAVVERKTLADLVSSVKDHRYDDQKRRMKKSGMTRLYYLIENTNKANVASYEQMVWTVKSSTQVVDGFICNIFDSMAGAIKHLKRMTTVMTEIYEHKTLFGIPLHATSGGMYLKQLDVLRKEERGSEYLPTLKTWNKLNGKQHTIGTNWAAMVLCHNGISAEKACAIVERWPTTQAFLADISRRKRQEEENGEVATKKPKTGSAATYIMEEVSRGGKRDLGLALSQQLYDIWTQSEYK